MIKYSYYKKGEKDGKFRKRIKKQSFKQYVPFIRRGTIFIRDFIKENKKLYLENV